jgi:drug/metabolite transporter (DMT)-like permease
MSSTPATLRARRATGAASLAAGVTVVAWASAFVAIRALGPAFDPGPLALGRLLVGSLALGAVLAQRRIWVAPTSREWALLTVCGVGWFAVYNLALNAAEQRLDAGTTSMLVNVGPILIALLAGVVLGEGFPRWLLVGALVAFLGAALIGWATSESAGVDPLGVMLSLLAALTYAIGVLAQKPAVRRLPALQVTFVACAIGTVTCLPFAPDLTGQLDTASPTAVAGLVYLGLVPTALAFATWACALSRVDAGRLGVTTYLVPPLTIAASWPLLGEVPVPLALLGGALCLVGVAVSRRRTPVRVEQRDTSNPDSLLVER